MKEAVQPWIFPLPFPLPRFLSPASILLKDSCTLESSQVFTNSLFSFLLVFRSLRISFAYFSYCSTFYQAIVYSPVSRGTLSKRVTQLLTTISRAIHVNFLRISQWSAKEMNKVCVNERRNLSKHDFCSCKMHAVSTFANLIESL